MCEEKEMKSLSAQLMFYQIRMDSIKHLYGMIIMTKIYGLINLPLNHDISSSYQLNLDLFL